MSKNTCIHIERVYNRTAEEVFSAWTDREQWVKWMGPQGFTVRDCSVDARAGGAYRCTMRSPDGDEHTVTGVFQAINPGHISMTWGWETDGKRSHESVVEVEIASRGDRAVMMFDHCGFESDEARASHEQGWLSSFERLGPAVGS